MEITKEEFCKIIDRLQKSWDKQNQIIDALGAVIDTGDVSDMVVDLLNKLMELESDELFGSDIGYFCWELDFGRKWTPDSIQDINGNPIDISTSEKLYDYLISDQS